MNFGADLIFFFFLAFLVFGPRKLPEIARTVGKAMAELRRASNEFRFSLEEEIRNADLADEAKKAQATLSSHPAAGLPAANPDAANPEQEGTGEEVAAERAADGEDAEGEFSTGEGPAHWHEHDYRGYGEEDFAAPEWEAEAHDADETGEEVDAESEPAEAEEVRPEQDVAAHFRASNPPDSAGVAGTVPATERPWPAPERRT